MVPSNAVNSHFTAVIQDESYNTCAVFSPLFGASWYTDFIIPLYYINKTEIVTVELFGENIGCSSDDDAKFYLFPISTWNESTDLLGRRETCKFHESSIDVGTGQQKCAYRCQYSYNSKALRIIKIPYNETQSEWKLCEVTNLFYGKFLAHANNQYYASTKFFLNILKLLLVNIKMSENVSYRESSLSNGTSWLNWW